MANQKVLEEYLVGSKTSYLRSDDNNGKVIMLSGKWGSGKTHFWQEKVVPKLNEENNKTPNHYVSLYGKTSIDEIKNEVFLKVFESVHSFELKEKANKVVKNTTKLVSSVSKTITVFGVNIDLTKVSDKPFDKIDEILENKKLEKTQEYLNSGAIICFDDFERKSKEIDLNDLFGFITQLSLNFECKIVIILNDDVFEGKEKDIFSNVKEKTVSKYLFYNPSIEELFNLIFISKEKYKELEKHRDLILNTIKETEELNARIYMQVLDNFLEWVTINDNEYVQEKYLRYLILQNINFILNHDNTILILRQDIMNKEKSELIPHYNYDSHKADEIVMLIVSLSKEYRYIKTRYLDNEVGEKYINLSNNEINSIYFMKTLRVYIDNYRHTSLKMKEDIVIKINDFIKIGILIKDENK